MARVLARRWRWCRRPHGVACSTSRPPPLLPMALLTSGLVLLLFWATPSAASASAFGPQLQSRHGATEQEWQGGWGKRPESRRALLSRHAQGARLRSRLRRWNMGAGWDSTRDTHWGMRTGEHLGKGSNGGWGWIGAEERNGLSNSWPGTAGFRGRASSVSPSPTPKCEWCAGLADGWHKDSNHTASLGSMCFLCQAGTLRRMEGCGPHCPCAIPSLRRGEAPLSCTLRCRPQFLALALASSMALLEPSHSL